MGAPATPVERAAARRALALPDDAVVIRVLGRLSPHSKMDMFPLRDAISACFQDSSRSKVHVVAAGWCDDGATYPQSLASAFAAHGVALTVAQRPSEESKRSLYRSADVFVSLSDNPQETFGLTLLEAQAAGLPCVVTDYDGYRDVVADGVTGYLIPTFGVADTATLDVMSTLLHRDELHLLLSQSTALDAEALRAALAALFHDAGLRLRMGEAGIERVRSGFLWRHCVSRHLELWHELWLAECPRIDE